ncbi:VOC family protein [Amycolatopsis acidicola]|uniref:VOC family protein n=1 Tax=Amycolatopsis acidicola TaxID=2596893 RepID=A0A5N0VKD5_9PSEU|nr:VOC family protein [Amycolatopsis acidicola]KAA9165620.1 VOC family protein [Amycolatopsis acidicola]
MKTISPCLWFDDQAEEAANFYVSVFPDSKITDVTRYDTTLVVEFELDGRPFLAFNGGPMFTFNEAISLEVRCDSQDEVDRLWTRLTENGGQESSCGWLKDKYGVSWQIVPQRMLDMMTDPDQEKAGRVMRCMLASKKLDLAELTAAYEGRA